MALCASGNAPNITALNVQRFVMLDSGQCGVPQWPGCTKLSRGVDLQRGHASRSDPARCTLGSARPASPLYYVRCPVEWVSAHGSASPCAGAGEVHRQCFASVSQCAGAQMWCRLAGASWQARKFQRLWCTPVPENDITPHCPQCSPVTALKLRLVSPTACAPFG